MPFSVFGKMTDWSPSEERNAVTSVSFETSMPILRKISCCITEKGERNEKLFARHFIWVKVARGHTRSKWLSKAVKEEGRLHAERLEAFDNLVPPPLCTVTQWKQTSKEPRPLYDRQRVIRMEEKVQENHHAYFTFDAPNIFAMIDSL